MLGQTGAIFLDAYRELHSRRLFWVTLVLSALVVLIFALVGIDENGLSIAGWHFDAAMFNTNMISEETFYKSMFIDLGIGMWLAWIATILALVSTAGMVPDLISSGTIDLVLSKPIGRLRLFFTKYAAALLFVMLQVSVFSLVSLIVLGLRAGVWAPGILLAIPIVVVFFSYLYCVCALLGLLTRSTIAALLLTLLFWFGIFMLHTGESVVLMFKLVSAERVEQLERDIDRRETRLEELHAEGIDDEAKEPIRSQEVLLDSDREEVESTRRTANGLGVAHRILFGLKTVLPKTNETVGLLQRWLLDLAELGPALEEDPNAAGNQDGPFGPTPQVQRDLIEAFQNRSVWWVMGTSLAFEAVVLAFCGWVFWRRDF